MSVFGIEKKPGVSARLQYNLYSKHKLCFHDGVFRILQFSDIQERLAYDQRSLDLVEYLLDETKPDFVLFGGDVCDREVVFSLEDAARCIDTFMGPMERRKIPWSHIYGNHDHENACDDRAQQQLFERKDYCLSKHTEADVHGVTNFMLPLWDEAGKEVRFALWGLDTGGRYRNEDFLQLAEKPYNMDALDYIRFSQLKWYWDSAAELEAYQGSKVNGMLFLHIAPWEFQWLQTNGVQCGLTGNADQKLRMGMLNSGLFATLLERGEIRCIAAAHCHQNDFDGELAGIRLCFDGSIGYSTYGIRATKGGRVFELREEELSTVRTYMVHAPQTT